MAAAAAAMHVIGGVTGAIGAVKSSQQQAANDEYNANIARQQAAAVSAQATADATRQDLIAQQHIGQIEAQTAGSGITGSGSALSILAMSTASAKLDEQTILYKGAVQSTGYLNQAALDVYAGKIAKQQGYFDAFSSLVSGGGKAGSTMVQANAMKVPGPDSASGSLMSASPDITPSDYGSIAGMS
jgi:hypothetical protein